MDDNPRRAAGIYARMSMDEEAGIARQVDDCRELAARRGLTVVEVFTDNKRSAYRLNAKRPAYDDLLAAIQAGAVDVVIAWASDRLHRRPAEGLPRYIDACKPRAVPTYFVKSPEYDLATADGRYMAYQLGIIDQREVEKKAERQRRANLQRAMAGGWNGRSRPFGYDDDGVTIRPDEAAALRWAADQVLAGGSLRSIAREWNRRGLRTARGNPWVAEVVGRTLQRDRLAGRVVYQGQVLDGITATWPAIIDPDAFDAVRAILTDPGRSTVKDRTRKYLLGGLALCGVEGCDQTVRTNTDPGKAAGGRNLRLYVCRSGAHVRRQAEAVEEYVEAAIIERLSRPDARELFTPEQRQDLDDLHRQDRALGVRLDALAGQLADDEITAGQFKVLNKRLRERRAEITAKLQAANHGNVLAGVADAPDVEAAWSGLDLSRKRAIVDTLVKVVILPIPHGPGKGRKGAHQFTPDYVRITWKRG